MEKREIYGIKVPSAAGATEAVQCGTSGDFSPAAALFHVFIFYLSDQFLDSLLPNQDCLRLSSSISECFLYPDLGKNARYLSMWFCFTCIISKAVTQHGILVQHCWSGYLKTSQKIFSSHILSANVRTDLTLLFTKNG